MTLANVFWMAGRYLAARRNPHAAFINWASFAGLTAGVVVLTVVASVMNGFDRELRTRLLGTVPHVLAVPPGDGFDVMPSSPAEVVSSHRFFAGAAMIAVRGTVQPLVLYGVDLQAPESLALVARRMVTGSVEALGANVGGVLLGAPLAALLGVGLGDPVVLVVTEPRGAGIRPRVQRFTLRGTFEVGAQPDYSLAVVRLADVRARGIGAAGVSGWRMQLADPMAVGAVAAELRDDLPTDWTLRLWTDTYGDLFRAVRLEKTLMFVFLAMVVAIAAFNMVAGQTMLVNDKRADIAMLETMGAPTRFLVQVFLVQGFAIAVVGVAAGLAVGALIAWNAGPVAGALSGLLGGSILDGTPYDALPAQVLVSDLAIIAGLSLGLCFLAVLRPALKAVAENPAPALHATG